MKGGRMYPALGLALFGALLLFPGTVRTQHSDEDEDVVDAVVELIEELVETHQEMFGSSMGLAFDILDDQFLQNITNTSMNAIRQAEVIAYHNELRKMENGKNLIYLKWNNELAGKAQELADTCVYAHGMMTWDGMSFSSVGQNLFFRDSALDDVTVPVRAWYNEKYYYTYSGNQCSAVCGHYTQVVWSSTKYIGCGYQVCPSLTIPGGEGEIGEEIADATIVVCNYSPSGNVAGTLPYKEGGQCKSCPSSRRWCYGGLCRNCPKDGVNMEKCECAWKCKNGGTLDPVSCECTCPAAYWGTKCQYECIDHESCGANPGWPAYWCDHDDYGELMLDLCPGMCGQCAP